MPISIINEKICFVRLALSPIEIPGLLERHAKNYPGGGALEQLGKAIKDSEFQPKDACAFVENVVRWGGGQRFVGRLLAQNTPDQISKALNEAHSLLLKSEAASAVSKLQELRYLGQSFASKVARFLIPTAAVILDDVIRGALGYRADRNGYQEFLFDCQATLGLLTAHHPQLRVCDVEAAIFAKIQGY